MIKSKDWAGVVVSCWKGRCILLSHEQTSHVHTLHTIHTAYTYLYWYINIYTILFFLSHWSTVRSSVSPWSFILGMQMPWAQTPGDLSPHLSLHTSACALVSACCSFLPSFSQSVSRGTWDSPTCSSMPLTHPHSHVHAYTQSTCKKEGDNVQLRSPLRRPMLLSPRLCQPCWGPVIQSVHDHAQRSLHLEHQQSARCLSCTLLAVLVHYWKP